MTVRPQVQMKMQTSLTNARVYLNSKCIRAALKHSLLSDTSRSSRVLMNVRHRRRAAQQEVLPHCDCRLPMERYLGVSRSAPWYSSHTSGCWNVARGICVGERSMALRMLANEVCWPLYKFTADNLQHPQNDTVH
jgi:hypothetical protein